MSSEAVEVTSSRKHVRPLTIAVEGNIGCGKSTFLSFCGSDETFEIMQEPVDKWKNVNGVNLLGNFYREPLRYGLVFQMQVNLSLLEQYRSKSSKSIKLVERSLLSSRNCFQKSMLLSGVLEPVMGSILDQWYDSLNPYESLPHAIVYLQTSAAVAYQRVLVRNRPEESTVTLEYLHELGRLHEEWLLREKQRNIENLSDMPIFVVNTDRPLHDLRSRYQQCIADMKLLLL